MKTTTNVHRRLMTLLSRQGYDTEARHELVWQFTNMRTESTRDLTNTELWELCNWLEQRVPKEEQTTNELLLREKRAIVLSIATRVGIHDTNDWGKFNAFMLHRSILKKPLKDYKLKELNRLIQQFRRIEENYNNSADSYNTKAFWHRGSRLVSLN